MELFVLVAVIGLIPAAIASQKGHSFLAWWIFGALLFIVALPMALIAKPNETSLVSRGEARQCPYCAELIKREARVCRYCQRDVSPVAPEVGDKTGRPMAVGVKVWKLGLIGALVIVGGILIVLSETQ